LITKNIYIYEKSGKKSFSGGIKLGGFQAVHKPCFRVSSCSLQELGSGLGNAFLFSSMQHHSANSFSKNPAKILRQNCSVKITILIHVPPNKNNIREIFTLFRNTTECIIAFLYTVSNRGKLLLISNAPLFVGEPWRESFFAVFFFSLCYLLNVWWDGRKATHCTCTWSLIPTTTLDGGTPLRSTIKNGRKVSSAALWKCSLRIQTGHSYGRKYLISKGGGRMLPTSPKRL